MLSSLRSTSANRSRRVRAALLACGAALGVATALAAFPGCAQEGTTPSCENNVTKDGILIHKVKDPATPCESFGKCYVGGAQRPAKDCCVNAKGEPLTGSSLTQCLYGFGEVDLDSTGGAGGGGGSTGGTGGSGGTTGP